MSEPLPLAAAARELSLASPEWLWGLLPLVAVAIAISARTRAAAIDWPALTEARAAGATRRDRVRLGALALRAGALVALAFAISGPVSVRRAPPEPGHGLDLVLVLDASDSMRAVDTRIAGQRHSRLALARRVVARFAETRATAGDRVALVVFGETAFTPCPLTSDGRLLGAALARVEASVAGGGTALGDALGLAVKRAIAGRASAVADGPVEGRAIVLLTDGRNNAGALSLEVATAIARDEGVRVHTVAIGTAGAEVPVVASESGGAADLRFERHDVDTVALAGIAAATGGRFFPARDSEQLAAVYREIDALERVVRRPPPRIRTSPHPEPLLALAGGFVFAELALARVLRRRLP